MVGDADELGRGVDVRDEVDAAFAHHRHVPERRAHAVGTRLQEIVYPGRESGR